MRHRSLPAIAGCVLLVAAVIAPFPVHSREQEQFQYETDLDATHRVFRDVGAGFRAIRRGPSGRYYVLTAPAATLQIFDKAGKQVGQIPSESTAKGKGAALVFGESFDVDQEGRIAVCDRGANAIKLYGPEGSLLTTIPVDAPDSVAFVSGGEIAVAGSSADHLVTVYDLSGKVVRDYGDREEISEQSDVNRQLNFGELATDDAGNTYFAFDFVPEPTVHKFDRAGYLTAVISLATLEFQPAAQAARKAIARSETGVPAPHRIISGIGVDPRTQEVWMAVGTLLMHFDKDGQRVASFRTYLPNGGRLEPAMILVEQDRLLIGADPDGIYEFPKPARLPQ